MQKDTIAIIISGVVGCGTIFGVVTANKTASDANRTANEAYETSKYQFLQLNRPYIILSPKRFDNKQYWKIKQEGIIIKIFLNYEIKNAGKVAAKDVMVPKKIGVSTGMELIIEDTPIHFDKGEKVTLAPGESINIIANITMGYENEETAKETYEYLISDKSSGIDTLLSVNYMNELDETQRYRTSVRHRIFKNVVMIAKSEVLMLGDESLTK